MVGRLKQSVCILIFACLVAGVAGCKQSTLPKTYSAKGAIIYPGGQPLEGGSVQFTSSSDPLLHVLAAVKNDGTFTLHTVKDEEQADGAPAGEYAVIVQPAPPPHDPKDVVAAQQTAPPISLPGTYKVEPKENTFKIELPAPNQ